MRRHPRTAIALALAALVTTGTVGCGLGDDPLADLARALSDRDAAAAAAHTDDPDAARAALQASFDGMGAADPEVTVAEDGAALDWTWRLPKDRTLHYTAPLSAEDGTVRWTPRLIHPDAAAGNHLLYSDDKAYTTPVLDRQNRPLLTWQEVTVISLATDHPDSADALAARLRPVDRTVTGDSIRATLRGHTGAMTVIALRAADAREVGDVGSIPGVTTRTEGRLLTATPDLRSPVTAGLEDRWRASIDAAAGAGVALVDERGERTRLVEKFPGTDVRPVRTTLDAALQRSAVTAVATEKRPTMLVAIRPSTGGILAVAQNRAADRQGPIALTGLYAPGSTFKTITTAAALDAGIATMDSTLPCPGRAVFGARSIPNENEFDLGTVPLHTAFAQSCNTTMAGLSTKLDDTALRDTAKEFGLGVDYTIPGITTVTGSVPPATTPAERVESGIGQGRVTASAFGLAVVEASLAHRRTVVPTLIEGAGTKSDTEPADIPAGLATALRSAMRETVTGGTATSLRDIDGLGGKTGTAEYGDNTHAHGWFAGIVGDLAFATLVVGGDSSTPAVRVSGDFLRAAGADLPR